jgi:integrase
MPLKIVRPRAGKTAYFYIRGTYLGVRLDESTKARDRASAAKWLKRRKREIEEGTFTPRTNPAPAKRTFYDAVVAYMASTGQERFLEPLTKHFRDWPLESIAQEAIDASAIHLYPGATPATRNRQVHTPMSAILKHAGIQMKLKRPDGSRGNALTYWHTEESAFAIFVAADEIDPELGLFLRLLCYAGLRLSEGLSLEVNRLELLRNFCYCGKTKNGEPRGVYLPDHLVEALKAHPRGLDRRGQRVFRFNKNGHLYKLINKVKKAAGQEFEPGKFHIFRHTYGTWMTQYGGLTTEGLVKTGAWKDEQSAKRYNHTVTTPEAKQADRLPVKPQRKVG